MTSLNTEVSNNVLQMRNVGKTKFSKTLFLIQEVIVIHGIHDIMMTISVRHVHVEVDFSAENTMIIKLP